MAAVWGKLTSQLSSWLAEGPPGKWRQRGSESAGHPANGGLRPSTSLSALNQRQLFRAKVRTSKSSENLLRIGGFPLQKPGESCSGERPESRGQLFSSRGRQGRQQADSPQRRRSNSSNVVARTGSRLVALFRDGQGTTAGRPGPCGDESGYSSGSPSRKKSAALAGSASSLFLQNLRGWNQHGRAHQQRRKGERAEEGAPSNASSSGASSGTAANCAPSSETVCLEAQKKRWWRLSSSNCSSSGGCPLAFADEDEPTVVELAEPTPADTRQRPRRPSTPGASKQQTTATEGLRLFGQLVSPPKRSLGPKKTKSTLAVLSPPNRPTVESAPFLSLLPMSQSWSSHLARSAQPQGPRSPPPPASLVHDDGLTVPASDEFGRFLRSSTESGETISSGVRERGANAQRKGRQSSANRLVSALLPALWRPKHVRPAQASGRPSAPLEPAAGQKRSRSVGANQQLRVSATMCVVRPPSECANDSGSLDDGALGPQLTLEDVHPAYSGTLVGLGSPQSGRGPPPFASSGKICLPLAPSTRRQRNGCPSPADMFRKLEKLGEGSYATVWKSENLLDGSIVALKEIRLQEQEGLPFTAIREISLLRALSHANIVRLHQIIIQQPRALVLVFEYMRTDLAKLMEQHPRGLDQYRTKVFLFQLLRGLAFCHERKILHRDLKPQNLLVSSSGELKLADFGLARAKSVPSRSFSHDVVTLWYRPPDVLLGSTVYSTSLDLWGVGCIFAEMSTGTALFPGANDVGDQLERIFSVRGLPQPERWPEARRLPKWAQFQFPAYEELDWARADPALGANLTEEGAKLLDHFLQLNPRDRVSAEGAMLHKYFDELPRTLHALLPTESVFAVLNGPSSYSSMRSYV